MKKLLLFCMSAALLASCSNEEPVTSGNNTNTVTNPDEISLGVSGLNLSSSVTSSKAAVDNFLPNDQFTVFGLSRDAGADWTSPNDRLFDSGFATGQITGNAGVDSYSMNFVNNLNQETHYYYPGYNGKNFSFFAAYPTVAEPQIETNQVTATYTVDGKTDIMWAGVAAQPVNGVEGYNAPYFRQTGAQKPKLNFQHQLTQLVFKFKKGDGFGTEELHVKNIRINNTYDEAVMTVATTDNAATPAAQFAGSGTQDKSMALYDANDEQIANSDKIIIKDEPAQATEVGYIMLVPAATYELYVELYTGNSDETSEQTVTVQNTTGNFLAGTKYGVTYTVTGNIEIEIAEVTIEPWQEEEIDGGEIGF